MCLHVNCACTIAHIWTSTFCCCSKWRRVRTLQIEPQIAKTATLANLQTNELKGATMMKAMSFCAWSSSRTALVCNKLCKSRVLYEKEEKRRKKMTISEFFGSLFLGSRVLKGTFASILWTVKQYHSICVLGLGFVASLAIIWLIHNYGKFEISFAIAK